MKLLFSILTFLYLLNGTAEAALKLNSSGKNPNFIYEYDPKALASSVSIILLSGSTADVKGKEGLTRFSLSALLRGTKQKSRAELMKAIESLGANIDVNTGHTYSSISLNTISENLPEGIRLLAETILQPALRPEEIEPLRDEFLAKLQVERSNNRNLLRRAYRLALYSGTPLAFPPEGTPEGLKAASIEDIRITLKTQLQAKNMVIAVTSNQHQAKVKTWLETAFKELPEGIPATSLNYNEKKIAGRTMYMVPRKGSSTVEINMGHYGIPATHPKLFEIETGLYVFGSNFNSRLIRVLRKENGWTYGAAAGFRYSDIGKGKDGIFVIYSFPQKEHAAKAAVKTIELYEAYVKEGVTENELAFAQNSMSNSYPFQFATSRSRLDAKLAYHLDGLPNLSVGAYQKKIRSIRSKQIKDALGNAHNPQNLVIVAVGDEEQLKEIAKAIPGLKETKIIQDPMSDKEFH